MLSMIAGSMVVGGVHKIFSGISERRHNRKMRRQARRMRRHGKKMMHHMQQQLQHQMQMTAQFQQQMMSSLRKPLFLGGSSVSGMMRPGFGTSVDVNFSRPTFGNHGWISGQVHLSSPGQVGFGFGGMANHLFGSLSFA